MDYSAFACVYLAAQSCPTLCNPMDCSLPGSSVHGDSPGKNTGVGCHFFLQGIFPTQGSNPGLLHCRQILYLLYITIIIYFVQTVSDLAIESSFQCPFTFSIIFWAFPNFLAPSDSFSNFLAPTPNEFSHFFKDPWFLVLKKWHLGTKIWVLDAFITWESLPINLLSAHS